METIKKFSEDISIKLLKYGKIATIEIINNDWDWMCKQLGCKTTMKIDWDDLINSDAVFWRNFINKTYEENKAFILETKMNRFKAY